MTLPNPVTLRADGTWRELAFHALRQLGAALALPLALWWFFHTPPLSLLILTAVGLGLVMLTSWGRLSWGRSVLASANGLRIERRNGYLLDIPASQLTAVRCKADCVHIAWQPSSGKLQHLVIGREGFNPSTWAELLTAVQALSPSTAASAPRA